MGIRELFHKIKMGFIRIAESPLPAVDEAKRYGNYGEDGFVDRTLARMYKGDKDYTKIRYGLFLVKREKRLMDLLKIWQTNWGEKSLRRAIQYGFTQVVKLLLGLMQEQT